MRRLLVLGAVLLVGACSSLQSGVSAVKADVASVKAEITGSPALATPSALEQIANFTIADLQDADKDAVAHGDAISHACYPALIKFVGNLQGNMAGGTVKGAFSAFQRARDLRHGFESGLPDYLKLGCAALVQDETMLLVKLGAIGAGAAVVGPVAIP